MKSEIKQRLKLIQEGKVPQGYKQTKIGIIPEDWEVNKLGEISKIIMGQSPDSKYYNDKADGIPLIQGNKDIKNRRTNPNYFTTHQTKVCDIGDIIMSVRAPVGEISKSLHNACIGRGVCAIKHYNNNDYLYHYLIYLENKWVKYSQGSTFEAVNSNEINNLKIHYPDIKEQDNITKIMEIWDEAIELKEKLLAEKKEFKRGLIQQLLTGEKRFDEFNKEWKKIALKSIVKKIRDKNEENNKTIVTISAKDGFINQEKYFNKVVASKDLTNYHLIKKGDFAYNKSYSNGYPVGVIKRLDSFEKAVVTTLYICFRIKSSLVSSDFLKFYFESGLLNRQINKIANEGGRSHGLLNVTSTDFFNIIVNLPEYQEQKKIAKILSTIEKEIDYHQSELEALQQQKKGLMQLLLTGIVRVKVN